MSTKKQSNLLKTLLGKESKTLQIDPIKNAIITSKQLLKRVKTLRRQYGR